MATWHGTDDVPGQAVVEATAGDGYLTVKLSDGSSLCASFWPGEGAVYRTDSAGNDLWRIEA